MKKIIRLSCRSGFLWNLFFVQLIALMGIIFCLIITPYTTPVCFMFILWIIWYLCSYYEIEVKEVK